MFFPNKIRAQLSHRCQVAAGRSHLAAVYGGFLATGLFGAPLVVIGAPSPGGSWENGRAPGRLMAGYGYHHEVLME